MARKLALKRLTASDLTVFRYQYINRRAGNQKAINLDSQVLVGKLYPDLGKGAVVPNTRYKLELKLSGPGICDPQTLVRKILKQQKNWRLNGEFIDGPVDDPQRYNYLEADDFALFEFLGDRAPESIHLLLVSAASPADRPLYEALDRTFRDGPMRVLEERDIEYLLKSSNLDAYHPLAEWADGHLLESAALGSSEAVAMINSRVRAKGPSPEEFLEARRRAEAIGVYGEELLNDWFLEQQHAGLIAGFQWSSSTNAVCPFDFEVQEDCTGPVRRLDAKSTSGEFSSKIHLSRAELSAAVDGGVPYDIYRLYGLDERGASMKVAYNVGDSLSEILDRLSCLPIGVWVDSISIDPRVLPFSEHVIRLRNGNFFDSDW